MERQTVTWRFWLSLLIISLLAMPTLAQTLPPVNPAEQTGDIITGGSSSVAPLVDAMAQRFSDAGYQGNIVVDELDMPTAFTRFCNGELDIVLSDRQITQDETAACNAAGRTPLAFRVAINAAVVGVSTQNSFLVDVTVDEVRQIFSSALSWSDVRAEWSPDPVRRFTPSDDSGVFNLLVQRVFNGDPAPVLTGIGAQAIEDDAARLTAVTSDPMAVSVFPSALAAQNAASLKALAINGVGPNVDAVTAGRYPLTSPLILYSNASLMQNQPQVAAFLNYIITSASVEVTALGLYPASTADLNAARNTWLQTAQGATAQPVAPPVEPVQPVEPTPESSVSQPVAPQPAQPVEPVETAPVAPVTDGSVDAQVLLTNARGDLQLLVTEMMETARPEGWSGNRDTNNPQFALLLRLDLELLAGTLLGEANRPAGWLGAIPGSLYSQARDIRHDLERLADDLLAGAPRPEGWNGSDPLLRCNRSTQVLVQMLQRGGVFTLDVDPTASNYCYLAEIAATTFSEVNLLSNPSDQAIFSPSTQASLPGAISIQSDIAVAFLDVNAALRVGVIPQGTPITPVARSDSRFSRMMLVQNSDFLVFVEYTAAGLTEDQYETLPFLSTVEAEPFCQADWCG